MSADLRQEHRVPGLHHVDHLLHLGSEEDHQGVDRARRQPLAAVGMLLAVVGTLLQLGSIDYRWIAGGVVAGSLIGALMAKRVEMTEMPELVALLNGLGGASSALVALSVVWAEVIEVGATDQTVAALVTGGAASAVTIALSIIVGGITFTGSVLALLKLKEKLNKGAPIMLPGRHVINAVLRLGRARRHRPPGVHGGWPRRWACRRSSLTAISLVLGVLLVIPIGGADMPVVVSLLNSYSGVAACATGFVIKASCSSSRARSSAPPGSSSRR